MSSATSESQKIEVRKLSKRSNWSQTRRISPYPPALRRANAFPTQEKEVLKKFEDSYDRLRSNRALTAQPDSSAATRDDEKHEPTESTAMTPERKDNDSLSYIGMIATAILNSPETKLTLAGIYSFMEEHFQHILSTRPGWKNTVRHNLSLHDCFVKGEIAAEGKGRFWRIHPNYFDQFKDGKFNKNILQNVKPSFYHSMANYRLIGREDVGSFPMRYPFHGSTWTTGLYPLVPSSYPYQTLPFHRPSPTTARLFSPRDYRDFQPFHFRECTSDYCEACPRIRSLPPLLSHGCEMSRTLVNENGTRCSPH